MASNESGNQDIWVHDLTRSTKTRLTFDAEGERTPAWSPSGEQLVYAQQTAGGSSLMRKAADGTGEAAVLVEAKDIVFAPDWSRDGRYLVYQQNGAETGNDIRYVELSADGAVSEPVIFLGTAAQESVPTLSSDGRFVAYTSDESGRDEIYVRPFPDGDGRWQASVNGGSGPRWSKDGRELYYVQDNSALMSVSVSTGQGVALGQPRQLFEAPNLVSPIGAPNYDVSSDDQRFVTLAPVDQGAEEQAPPKIRVVENWYEEFRNRKQ